MPTQWLRQGGQFDIVLAKPDVELRAGKAQAPGGLRLVPVRLAQGLLDGPARAVGHVLAARLPVGAVACRFCGDEFVVVIPDCAAVRAEAVAHDIRGAIKALTPELAGRWFPAGTLSVSVGAACLSFATAGAPGSSPASDVEIGEALFRAADGGLYAAKEQGRDRVTMVILPASPKQWM